jgi:hypothetical protein
MGRGRAKAKQTKVARQLKYSSGGTDLSRLQQELAGEHGSTPLGVDDDEADDDEDYSAYGDYDAVDDEDENVGS